MFLAHSLPLAIALTTSDWGAVGGSADTVARDPPRAYRGGAPRGRDPRGTASRHARDRRLRRPPRRRDRRPPRPPGYGVGPGHGRGGRERHGRHGVALCRAIPRHASRQVGRGGGRADALPGTTDRRRSLLDAGGTRRGPPVGGLLRRGRPPHVGRAGLARNRHVRGLPGEADDRTRPRVGLWATPWERAGRPRGRGGLDVDDPGRRGDRDRDRCGRRGRGGNPCALGAPVRDWTGDACTPRNVELTT